MFTEAEIIFSSLKDTTFKEENIWVAYIEGSHIFLCYYLMDFPCAV